MTMNEIEKRFVDGLVEQVNQLKASLDDNKKAQNEVDEKYRLLAEQEKKSLKLEEESYKKMITALDTSTIAIYGKPLSEISNEESENIVEDNNETDYDIDKVIVVKEDDVIDNEIIEDTVSDNNDVDDSELPSDDDLDDTNSEDEDDPFSLENWPDIDEEFK